MIIPAGWHPDHESSGHLRWWDGHQWTSATRPSAQPPNPTPLAGKQPTAPQQKRRNLILAGLLAVGVVTFAVVNAWRDADDDTQNTAAPTSQSAPTQSAPATTAHPSPATTSAAAASITRTTEPAAEVTPSPAPRAAAVSDPRCAAANLSLGDPVTSGLSDATLTLTNGTIIDTGPYTFLGATTLRPDGSMANRSDVWIVDGKAVYSSTGGARNESIWPKASRAIGISPGDEAVQAVDDCVVGITTGR